MIRPAALRKYAEDIRGAARFGFSHVTHVTYPIDCFEDALAPLVARLLEDEANRMERGHDRFEALPAAGAVNMSDLVPVAWIYETWIGADGWIKHLTFERPVGHKWQRRIVPLYAAPQPQPDVKPPAAADKDYRWRDDPSPLNEHDEAVERAAARQARDISGAE
jgi:hypothetical protein